MVNGYVKPNFVLYLNHPNPNEWNGGFELICDQKLGFSLEFEARPPLLKPRLKPSLTSIPFS